METKREKERMTGGGDYLIADKIHCKRTKRKSLDNDEGINSSGFYNNFKYICTQYQNT